MADVSKNNKILKFEVSARFDKSKDQVSLFATDHDFAGLPFKVNILNTSNTHDSIISVMKDYGINVSEQLIQKHDSKNTIPVQVDYPEYPLSMRGLVPLGVGENGSLIHTELRDVLDVIFVQGTHESGKDSLLNTIIQGTRDECLLFYVNDIDSLKMLNHTLLYGSIVLNKKRILVFSDGFNTEDSNLLKKELEHLFATIKELENKVSCIFSIQDIFSNFIRENISEISHRTIIMGGLDPFILGTDYETKFSKIVENVQEIVDISITNSDMLARCIRDVLRMPDPSWDTFASFLCQSPDDETRLLGQNLKHRKIIHGRASGSRMFVNGKKIPVGKRIDFQVYSTKENLIKIISHKENLLNFYKLLDIKNKTL